MNNSKSILISNDELKDRLFKLIKESHAVRIVSAFISFKAVIWFENSISHRNVVFVGRFTPADFVVGASDIKALQKLVELGYMVYMNASLHAKIYDIDESYLFTGSANFTSRGLSLGSTSNIEAAVELPYTLESSRFVDKVVNSSILIDSEKLREMILFLDSIYGASNENINDQDWPFTSVNIDELFVSDLPLTEPLSMDDNDEIKDCVFRRIDNHLKNDCQIQAKSLFLQSKAYRWLMSHVELDNVLGVRFGEISAKLHTALKDDPSPYRKDVKLLQGNLYRYIQLLCNDELEIYIPGERSVFIRVRT
ncbi:phospholipase D-like domain-containing protein [Oceanisphaera sp. W20_SRM_FM3]|uniref:phospholipase D-like domain-containing protein n=1 Tax=Oceanisphaera sp. W20_SRM_FM3 TaxID=3240267 RepID=UPI003F9D1135